MAHAEATILRPPAIAFSHDQDPNRTSHPNFKCALELPATAIILVHRRNPTTLTRPACACAERRIRCPLRQRVSLTVSYSDDATATMIRTP